jgi:hypothetical protein
MRSRRPRSPKKALMIRIAITRKVFIFIFWA